MTTHETSINPFIVPETNFVKVDMNAEIISREDNFFSHLDRQTQNTQGDNSGLLSKHIITKRHTNDSAEAEPEEDSISKKLITEGINRKPSMSRNSITS